MTNTEALKDLYIALGGTAAEVAGPMSNVDVLNAIAAKFEGDGSAEDNAAAVLNIAAVAGKISGGGEPALGEIVVKNTTTLKFNVHAYDVQEMQGGGKAVSFGTSIELTAGKSASVQVPASVGGDNNDTLHPYGYIEIRFASASALGGRNITAEHGSIHQQMTQSDGKGFALLIGADDSGETPTITVA